MILTNSPEIIQSIGSVEDIDSAEYIGYQIVTNQRTIEILIDNQASCCEQWGYITDDESQDFSPWIGAELEYIELINKDNASVRMLLRYQEIENGETNAIFVNVETNRGKLQFSVYNSHNGYYGHHVIVRDNTATIYSGGC